MIQSCWRFQKWFNLRAAVQRLFASARCRLKQRNYYKMRSQKVSEKVSHKIFRCRNPDWTVTERKSSQMWAFENQIVQCFRITSQEENRDKANVLSESTCLLCGQPKKITLMLTRSIAVACRLQDLSHLLITKNNFLSILAVYSELSRFTIPETSLYSGKRNLLSLKHHLQRLKCSARKILGGDGRLNFITHASRMHRHG